MELFRRSWGAEVNYPMQSNSAHNGMEYGASGVDGTGHAGGILAFWKESLPISSCSGCGQALYLIFQDPKIGPWVISGVYASPNMEIRNWLWQESTEINKVEPHFVSKRCDCFPRLGGRKWSPPIDS
ncbi:hypothetical protein QJS10_CPA06g00239 [Acorus calamus]|uniref:Uncharacterized protein n=1 Tax=Acorus calamus TaxID=4465 RepID=A0AAV9EP21_ACOCL|nr:hypothetical protein QJS10_CPA06g00239 [Acorus calamus]